MDTVSTLSGVYKYAYRTDFKILSFEIVPVQISQPFGYTSCTLFKLWNETEDGHLEAIALDTLGFASSCWEPVSVDTAMLTDFDLNGKEEMCVVIGHSPVCDAYISFSEVLIYEFDFSMFELTKTTTQPEPVARYTHYEPIESYDNLLLVVSEWLKLTKKD